MAGRRGLRSPSPPGPCARLPQINGVRFNDGRFRVTTEAQLRARARFVFTGHWPLEAWVHYRGEPSGAAVAAARRAGSPWPEQMDRKMLRFVEKRGVRTDKTKRLQRGQKCCQRLDSRFHYLSKCAVNCLDKSEQRGVPTDKTPRARTEVLSARGEESKPVAMRGQAGDHQKRQGHPLSGARETWLAPNDLRAPVLPPHASRLTPLGVGRKLKL